MSEKVSKEQIRCLISGIYDLQKLRISAGNRLVQSFYIQRGITPITQGNSDKERKDAEKEVRKSVSIIKDEYKRLTDGIANGISVKKQLSNASSNDKDSFKFIQNDMDYRLVKGYMLLLESEEESIKVLDKNVKSHPLYDAFFKDIKGCGSLMSGVCLAYLDPYKARHVSSFYKYCGLDTVQDEDKDGNKLFRTCVNGNPTATKVRQKMIYLTEGGDNYEGKVKVTDEVSPEGELIYRAEDGSPLIRVFVTKTGTDSEGNTTEVPVYEDIETGEEYIGEVVVSEHGRRKGDTEMYEYIDRNGNTAVKRGLTYNPVIKAKLMGVLTGCLLKAKDPVYSKIYYDYRARLDKTLAHKDVSDGRKHMMAQRYMIKQFLRNLWTTWRDLEGLPVDEPYEVAKLGNKPHGLNEYQCEVAKKYK